MLDKMERWKDANNAQPLILSKEGINNTQQQNHLSTICNKLVIVKRNLCME